MSLNILCRGKLFPYNDDWRRTQRAFEENLGSLDDFWGTAEDLEAWDRIIWDIVQGSKGHSTSRRSNWDVKWPVSIMSHHMSRHVMKSLSATAMPLPCRHPTRLSVVPLIAVVISLSHLVTNLSMENWCHSILTHLRSNVVILPHIRLSSKSWDEISLPTTIDKKPEIVD